MRLSPPRPSAYSVARVEAAEIDEMDILNARMLAMQRAIDGLSRPAGPGPHRRQPGPRQPVRHSDAPPAASWAATARAPPSRRRPFWPRSAGTGMCPRSWTRKYPQYQFAKHKGYGTKLHYEMLDAVRPLPGAPEDLSEKVGGQAAMSRPQRRRRTGERRRWPGICGRRGTRCWPASGAAGSENWTWWPGTGRGTVCFVEVKLRGDELIALPREAVDRAQAGAAAQPRRRCI